MASLSEEENETGRRIEPAVSPRAASDAVLADRLSAWAARLLVAFRGFLARGRFSSLTRRIVAFNVAALFVLLTGILYLNQFREGLIDARRQSLLTQAEIIAGAIAQGATSTPDAQVIDPLAANRIGTARVADDIDAEMVERALPIVPENAAPILRRLVLPTQTRARLYDKEGWLVLDSRQLSASGQVVAFELPPPEGADDPGFLEGIADWMLSVLPGRDLERFREAEVRTVPCMLKSSARCPERRRAWSASTIAAS